MSWPKTALRHPGCVSHLWRCAHQQLPVAHFPPAIPLQQEVPPSTTQLFGFARPKDNFADFNSRTTAVFGETCLLPPPAETFLKQNRGKIRCLIQAVLKVVPTSARLWERGARRFVGGLCVKRLDEVSTFF